MFAWLRSCFITSAPSLPTPHRAPTNGWSVEKGVLKQLLKQFALVLMAAMPGGGVSSASSALAAPPSAEIVQVLLAGKAGVPGDFDPSSLFSAGDFLYAVGPYRQPSIHYFHRDASSGLLAYGGSVVVAKLECHRTAACLVGRRLYVLLTRWGNDGIDNRLAWYDLDAKTGKPEKKGVTPKLTWTDRPGHTEPAGWGECWSPAATRRTST